MCGTMDGHTPQRFHRDLRVVPETTDDISRRHVVYWEVFFRVGDEAVQRHVCYDINQGSRLDKGEGGLLIEEDK